MIERAAKRAAIGVARLRAAGNRAVRYRAGGNRAAAPPPAKDQAEEKPAGWNPNAGAPQPDRAGANGTVPLNYSVPQNSAVLPAADAAATAAQTADIPRWLRVTAGWAWRLLLLAALLYVVIVPFAAAVLLTALLQPLAARLRRSGLGPLGATWCTLLLAFALIGGAVWLVTTRVGAEDPTLGNHV